MQAVLAPVKHSGSMPVISQFVDWRTVRCWAS